MFINGKIAGGAGKKDGTNIKDFLYIFGKILEQVSATSAAISIDWGAPNGESPAPVD